MKTVLMIIFALIILRIDMFVGVVERGWEKLNALRPTSEVVTQGGFNEKPTVVTKNSSIDKSAQLQILLTEFSYNPDKETRELILSYLTANSELSTFPTVLLRGELDKWVKFTTTENIQPFLLLNGLMGYFKAEQLETLKSFYSLYFDANTELFLHYYPIQVDPICSSLKLNWGLDTLAYEITMSRKQLLIDFEEKVDETKKEFIQNCKFVLEVEESKITPVEEQ